MSSWLLDVYGLIGEEGLPNWLDMTVVKLLSPTLETWRTLSAWARIPLKEADTAAARLAAWQSIRELAMHTDDPALVDAAEKAGQTLPYLVGTRWNNLQAFLETIARRADASVPEWRSGLHSLYPLLGRVIDRLPEAIQKGLDDPNTPARIREDVLTVLGYPAATASGADVSRWIQAAHKQWDDWISDLGSRAERMTGAARMAGSLGDIAGDASTAARSATISRRWSPS